MKLKRITKISILAALLCVLSPISFPVGAIPISLATFVIYVIATILNPIDTLFVILVYIALGSIGIPVFSFYRSGIETLFGLTGGYIVGYIFIGLATSIGVNKRRKQFGWYIVWMTIGTIICYAIGSIWYMAISKSSLNQTLMVAVIPFIIPDVVKMLIASYVGYFINNKTNIGIS